MASDKQPTNEQIVKQLETISKQLGEIRKGQKHLENNIKQLARSGR